MRKKIVKITRKIFEKYLPTSLILVLQNNLIYKPRIKELYIDKHRFPLFNSVYFEVRTRCNNKCSFCAASTQNEKREDHRMPIDMYIRVIRQLSALNFSGKIAYHINNDPLTIPNLPEFVSIARKYLPKAWIQILTNGIALSLKKAEKLIDSGINELSINYYNDDLKSQLPEILLTIRDKIIQKRYNYNKIKRGHGPDLIKGNKIFRFNIFRRKLNEILTSRAGTAPNKEIQIPNLRGFCEYPFTQLNITTNGTVSKCCADLYFSDPMGNVNTNSLIDIWYGEKFNKVRVYLLQNNRFPIETCRKCDYFGVKKVKKSISKIFYYFIK